MHSGILSAGIKNGWVGGGGGGGGGGGIDPDFQGHFGHFESKF